MRVAKAITLDAETEQELRGLARQRRIEARLRQRAQLVLLAAEGWRTRRSLSKSASTGARSPCGAAVF